MAEKRIHRSKKNASPLLKQKYSGFLHEGVHTVGEKFNSAQGSVYFVKYDDGASSQEQQVVLKNVS